MSRGLVFLVQVYEKHEYILSPADLEEKDTMLEKIANLFLIDMTAENARKRVEEHLPDSKDKYKIDISQAENEVDEIYKFGKIFDR